MMISVRAIKYIRKRKDVENIPFYLKAENIIQLLFAIFISFILTINLF